MYRFEKERLQARAKAAVDLALPKLEELPNFEVVFLSGLTPLTDALKLMGLVQNMLRQTQGVLVHPASNLKFEIDDGYGCEFEDDEFSEFEDDEFSKFDHEFCDDFEDFRTGEKWINTVIDVCFRTERAIVNFLEDAGRSIPFLPESVKRISSKPVNLFCLHTLVIEMSKIKSELLPRLKKIPVVAFDTGDGASGSIVLSPLSNFEDMGLVGYELLQNTIVEKLLDPSIPESLEIAILGPDGAGKSRLAQNIYQRSVPVITS